MNNPKQSLRGHELHVQIGCLGPGCLAELAVGPASAGVWGKRHPFQGTARLQLPNVCLGRSQGLQPPCTIQLSPRGLQVPPKSLPATAECARWEVDAVLVPAQPS